MSGPQLFSSKNPPTTIINGNLGFMIVTDNDSVTVHLLSTILKIAIENTLSKQDCKLRGKKPPRCRRSWVCHVIQWL